MKTTDYYWILFAGVLCISGYIAVEYVVNGAFFSGFPLDDSWIHAQFAHNVALGNGFIYTGTEQTPGDTSPLWVFLVAGAFRVFGESHVILEIRVLSCVAYLLTGVMTAATVYNVTGNRRFGLISGIAVICLYDLIWAGNSGMETSLFSLLIMTAFWSYLNDIRRLSIRTGVLFGLAALTRPEATILFGFSILDVVFAKSLKGDEAAVKRSFVRRLFEQWRAVLAFIILLIPFMIYCRFATGHLFPNTYYAKGGGLHIFAPFYGYISRFYFVLFGANPILFALACAGIYAMIRRAERYPRRMFIYFFLLFPLIGSVASATDIVRRYFFSFLPLMIPPAMIGIGSIASSAAGGAHRRRVEVGLAAAVILVAVIMNVFDLNPIHYAEGKAYGGAEFFAWSVHNINEQQVRVAKWVSANVPPNAIVAVNDVGAMGYMSRHRLIDVCGLVSNEVTALYTPHAQQDVIDRNVLDYLKMEAKPDYVIIYKSRFPLWAQQLPVAASFGVVARHNVVCASDTMTVMKMDWSK